MTVSTPVMRVLCNAFPHPPPPHPPPPRSFFIFLLCFRHHGYQEAHFFQGSCSTQMSDALWIYNWERPVVCISGKCIEMQLTYEDFVERELQVFGEGLGEVADVPGAGLLYAFFPPSIWPFCPRKLSSQFLLPPIWSSFSSDGNITHHQGKQLHM